MDVSSIVNGHVSNSNVNHCQSKSLLLHYIAGWLQWSINTNFVKSFIVVKHHVNFFIQVNYSKVKSKQNKIIVSYLNQLWEKLQVGTAQLHRKQITVLHNYADQSAYIRK